MFVKLLSCPSRSMSLTDGALRNRFWRFGTATITVPPFFVTLACSCIVPSISGTCSTLPKLHEASNELSLNGSFLKSHCTGWIIAWCPSFFILFIAFLRIFDDISAYVTFIFFSRK